MFKKKIFGQNTFWGVLPPNAPHGYRIFIGCPKYHINWVCIILERTRFVSPARACRNSWQDKLYWYLFLYLKNYQKRIEEVYSNGEVLWISDWSYIAIIIHYKASLQSF